MPSASLHAQQSKLSRGPRRRARAALPRGRGYHGPADEAGDPDSVPERGGHPAPGPARAAPGGGRLRRGRVAPDRRRVQRSDRRGRASARGRPRRQADQQQGPGRRLPGRDRRRPEAGGGRDRQHRRRPPVPGGRHPEAGRADPRRPRRHGGRRQAGQGRRALLGLEEVAPAARKLGGAARLGNRRPRHDLGLSRLQPGGGAPAPGRLQLHLHAREPDPGGQDAGRGRARPDSEQPGDPRVPAGRLHPRLRAPQRARRLSRLRPLRAAAGVHDRRLRVRRRRADRLDALPARLDPQRRPKRPRPVADPGRRPGADRRSRCSGSGWSATRSPASG